MCRGDDDIMFVLVQWPVACIFSLPRIINRMSFRFSYLIANSSARLSLQPAHAIGRFIFIQRLRRMLHQSVPMGAERTQNGDFYQGVG